MKRKKTSRAVAKKKTTKRAPPARGGKATEAPKLTKKRGGEGDYESAERYQRDATAFARSGKVAKAAEDAKAALETDEQEELAAAERVGRSRSRGGKED